MNIFKKYFFRSKNPSQSLTTKISDQVIQTRLGIKKRKDYLAKSLHQLAEIRAMAIQTKNQIEILCHQAAELEEKAIRLVKAAEAGELDKNLANEMAFEALLNKEKALDQASIMLNEQLKYERLIVKRETQISSLRASVRQWKEKLNQIQMPHNQYIHTPLNV
jgi:phage shock protein A